MHSIGEICKYNDTPTAEKMINYFATIRLDYCNKCLYGISQIQLCQKNATRMLSLRHKYDLITPVPKDLHRLPVEQRIKYNVLLLTYEALRGKAPVAIPAVGSVYSKQAPTIRPNNPRIQRCRLEGFDRSCFSYVYLFNVAYSSIKWRLCCMSILFVTLFDMFS